MIVLEIWITLLIYIKILDFLNMYFFQLKFCMSEIFLHLSLLGKLYKYNIFFHLKQYKFTVVICLTILLDVFQGILVDLYA